MLIRSSRRLFAVFATLSLVCTLVVTACPTCDIDVHAAIPSADGCCEDGPLVNDWQAGADGCACCESDGCGDGEELPRGLIQRSVSASPTTVAVVASVDLSPRNSLVGALPERFVDPPGKTKIHIQHASFLC